MIINTFFFCIIENAEGCGKIALKADIEINNQFDLFIYNNLGKQ